MGRIWIFQGTVPVWRGDRAHGPAVCGLIPLAEERGKVRLFRKHLSRSDSWYEMDRHAVGINESSARLIPRLSDQNS